MTPLRFSIFQYISMALGCLLAILIGEGFLQSLSYGYNIYLKSRNHTFAHVQGELRILCLGESTTQMGNNFSYPRVLERRLRKKYPLKKMIVINEGVPGTTTRRMLKELPILIERHQPHIIITMMGINDKWNFNSDLNDFSTSLDSPWKLIKLFHLTKVNFLFKFKNTILQHEKKELLHSPRKLEKLVLWDSRGFEFTISPDSVEHPILGLKKKRPPSYFPQSPLMTIPKGENAKIGQLFFEKKNYKESLKYLQLALNENPHHFEIIQKIIFATLNLGNISQARKFLGEIPPRGEYFLSLSISVTSHFSNLINANFYSQNNSEIEELIKYLIKRGRELSPKNPAGYSLAYTYLIDKSQQIDFLEKAISLNTQDLQVYLNRFFHYVQDGEWEKAEHFLISHLYFAYDSQRGDDFLTDYINGLIRIKNYPSAEHNLLAFKNLSQNPQVQKLVVGDLLLEPKNKTDQYLSDLLMTEPETIENYQKMITMILQKGIAPLVMQYPRLEIAPLKKILPYIPDKNFIKNVDNFEKTLQTKEFDEIFIDSFAGNFGHFSPLGSELVVDNIMPKLDSIAN